jgi:hypothetical protein
VRGYPVAGKGGVLPPQPTQSLTADPAVVEKMANNPGVLVSTAGPRAGLQESLEILSSRVVFHRHFLFPGIGTEPPIPRSGNNDNAWRQPRDALRRIVSPLFNHPGLRERLDLCAQDPDQLQGLLLLIRDLPELEQRGEDLELDA